MGEVGKMQEELQGRGAVERWEGYRGDVGRATGER